MPRIAASIVGIARTQTFDAQETVVQFVQWQYCTVDLNDLPHRVTELELLNTARDVGWELVARQDGIAAWQREATLGLFTSITTQIQPGAFLGAEARYLRKYDGLDLAALGGDALFVGPTMFVRLSQKIAVSGAWDVHVTGRAAGEPGAPQPI